MKKVIALKVAAAVCVFSFTALTLTACRTMRFKIENITMIELVDGTTGNRIDIVDPGWIEALTHPFNNNEFKKGESSKNQAGWSYWLKFYQGDKLTTSIFIHGRDGNRISYHDYFYDTNDGVIDTHIYRELLFYVPVTQSN